MIFKVTTFGLFKEKRQRTLLDIVIDRGSPPCDGAYYHNGDWCVEYEDVEQLAELSRGHDITIRVASPNTCGADYEILIHKD